MHCSEHACAVRACMGGGRHPSDDDLTHSGQHRSDTSEAVEAVPELTHGAPVEGDLDTDEPPEDAGSDDDLPGLRSDSDDDEYPRLLHGLAATAATILIDEPYLLPATAMWPLEGPAPLSPDRLQGLQHQVPALMGRNFGRGGAVVRWPPEDPRMEEVD